jgi:hypothetical protein
MKTKPIETKQHTRQFLLHGAAVGLLALAAVLPARADYSGTLMSLNPVGYWRLNEPVVPAPNYALGTATNYGSLGAVANGTYYHSSTLQEPGVIAGDPCVKLDGQSQYIEVPYSPELNTNGPFSVEFWANQTVVAAGAKSGVMSFDGNTGFLFYSDNNDPHWGFRVFYGTGRTYVKDTGPDNQPYTWYHVVGVFDGTLVHIYVNGVENAAPQPIGGSGYVPNTTAPLRIGAGNPAGAPSLFFPGWIDEVAIYPYALSPSQITAHYTAATANPAGYSALIAGDKPTGYWRFNEPLLPPEPVPVTVPVANQGSWGASANGAFTAGGVSSGVPGVAYNGFGTQNTACQFTGSSDSYIEIPAQNLVTDSWTVTCWAKRNGVSQYWSMLFSNPNDLGQPVAGPSHPVTGVGFGNGGNPSGSYNDLRMYWAGTDGTTGNYGATPNPPLYMPDQQWTFVAMVVSPSNIVLYMNLHSATNKPNTPYGPHDFGLIPSFIGKKQKYYGWASGSEVNGFRGTIDEVAVFDRALTADEIMQLYAAAEVPPIILVQPQAPPPPVYEGTSVSLSVQCDASASPLNYQWTKDGVPVPGQTAPELVLSNVAISDSGNYAVVINNTFGAVTSSIVALTVVSGPPVIVKPPESVSRYAGARTTFTVSAVGSAPLSYQWNLNGTPITGATSAIYALTEIAPGDAGTYTVVVSNPYGSANVSATLTVLTPTKLAAAIMERNPLGYWRMDETSGTLAYDSWGERNGTYGAGITNNVPGPEPPALKGFDTGNKAYAFDGSSGYVDVPAFGQIAGSMTIIAWIKPDAVQVDYTGLVFTRGGGGTVCGLDFTRGSQLGYTWNNAAGSYGWDSGLYPTPDQWNFVALVVEPTQATLYLDDGSSLWSSVNYLNHGTATWNAVRFGHDTGGPGARYFKGIMDDVAVYDHALTESEIKIIRDAGVDGTLVVTPVAVVEQPKGQTIMAGNSYVLQAKVVGTPPLAFQWKKNGQDIPGAVRSSLVFDSATESDTGTYQLFVTQGTTTISTTPVTLTVKPVPSYVNLSEGLVLHLKFDGDYKDSSGRNNNGEPRGVPEIVPGQIGSGALQYSTFVESGAVTAANYVSLGTPADLDFGPGQSFSVAFWIKFTGNPGDLPFIANNGYSMGDPGVTIAPSYKQGGWSWGLNDAIQPRPWPGIGLYDPVQNTLNDGNWHHLVHVFDRTGDGTTWLDGVKVHAMSIATAHDWDLRTGMEWCVGQAGGSYAEPGVFTIDDIGIWRRVLTDYDAQAIYVVGQRGLSFDTTAPPEVTLRVKKVGSDIVIEWSTGTLEYADNVQGPWSSVPDAIAPSVTVAPSSTARFYRVKVQ